MTDNKRSRGKGGQSQQSQQGQLQFGQSQFGQTMQPERQPSQQGRMSETDSQQNIQGEGSGSNRQAQQAHPNRTERLHSSQRSGGMDEPGSEDAGMTGRNAMSSRQQSQSSSKVQEVNADREQHMSGRDLRTGQQMGQGVISENPDQHAMAQTSLPSGFKSSRTWTQTSGGQQATQGSPDEQKKPGSPEGNTPKKQR